MEESCAFATDESGAFVPDDVSAHPARDPPEGSTLRISVLRAECSRSGSAGSALASAPQPAASRSTSTGVTKIVTTVTAAAAKTPETAAALARNSPHSPSPAAAGQRNESLARGAPGKAASPTKSPVTGGPPEDESSAITTAAVTAAASAELSPTSRHTPLIPEHRQVVKGAALPQLLRKSQLRAAPTGGSDSDTEDESGNNVQDAENSTSADNGGGAHSHPVANDSILDAEEQDAEQQFVDEFGFVIDETAKEKDEKYIRRIDGKQVVRREIKWANMASDWGRTNTKMHSKLKERCRKGIPSRFRGVAWQLLLGSFHQLNADENAGVYFALRDKKLADKEVDAIISRDLARTFPTHVLFQDAGGEGQTFLRNVLHAYAGSDPEVGYVQGMGFLVGAMSTQMGEEESFWALHEMMFNERYKMRELFRPGFPLLQQFFYQLKRLLARLLPKLSKRLDELDIQPSYFASQWFLTLFVAHFPFRALLRVWDIFFSEGWKIIFRTGIALMKWEESRLLSLSFDDMLPALKSLQDGKDARELLRRAHRIKFKTAELNRYGDEYWEKVGVIHRS